MPGARPVSTNSSAQPSEYTSVRGSTSLPSSCSGAAYSSVPPISSLWAPRPVRQLLGQPEIGQQRPLGARPADD